MPNNGVQIVKAESAACNAYIRMQGKHEVSPKIASCHANVADNAYKAAAGNEYTEHMPPDLFQFTYECFVVLNVSELIRILVVAFEVPIRRRCDNEMDGLIIHERQVPCVSVDQSMNCWRDIITQNLPDGQREPWQNGQPTDRPTAS